MYFKCLLYSLLVLYSIGLLQIQVLASPLYFTAPPQGFGISENNIGGYNAAQEKIYTCISHKKVFIKSRQVWLSRAIPR